MVPPVCSLSILQRLVCFPESEYSIFFSISAPLMAPSTLKRRWVKWIPAKLDDADGV
ncbi:predicted protein [Botrytis cinerea T4]|uniref:Uncharacterized protein n=1 Tax=Botryotinia fuckeliana (strain T4) TaxID=999810 RepID=G2YU33_BOTF4|nr:predicted protein [Botrytis cinerea T4]